MQTKILKLEDIRKYKEDIKSCYKCNPLIFDEDNYLRSVDAELLLLNYLNSDDSYIVGIISDDEKYLYGVVIYDNVRSNGETTTAQVHIAIDKAIWGKTTYEAFTDMLKFGLNDVVYCEVPENAVKVNMMCKRLGFKKTGYIPKALPYTNSKGEKVMHDIFIWTWVR